MLGPARGISDNESRLPPAFPFFASIRWNVCFSRRSGANPAMVAAASRFANRHLFVESLAFVDHFFKELRHGFVVIGQHHLFEQGV